MKYGVPQIDENFAKTLKRYKMGLFGSDIHTVAVNQAADGKATANITTNVPVWEIIIISALVPTIIYISYKWIKNVLKKSDAPRGRVETFLIST
jgi:hypothetical protein